MSGNPKERKKRKEKRKEKKKSGSKEKKHIPGHNDFYVCLSWVSALPLFLYLFSLFLRASFFSLFPFLWPFSLFFLFPVFFFISSSSLGIMAVTLRACGCRVWRTPCLAARRDALRSMPRRQCLLRWSATARCARRSTFPATLKALWYMAGGRGQRKHRSGPPLPPGRLRPLTWGRATCWLCIRRAPCGKEQKIIICNQ